MKDKTKQTRKGKTDREKQGVQVDALVRHDGIYEIKTREQAEKILRENSGKYCMIFDIDEGVNYREIPLTLRRCERECKKPWEYCGPNIWGRGFEKQSTYCKNCGYALKTIAEVAIAIQGSKVIECNYRFIKRS